MSCDTWGRPTGPLGKVLHKLRYMGQTNLSLGFSTDTLGTPTGSWDKALPKQQHLVQTYLTVRLVKVLILTKHI